jgi:hypothetical protein
VPVTDTDRNNEIKSRTSLQEIGYFLRPIISATGDIPESRLTIFFPERPANMDNYIYAGFANGKNDKLFFKAKTGYCETVTIICNISVEYEPKIFTNIPLIYYKIFYIVGLIMVL